MMRCFKWKINWIVHYTWWKIIWMISAWFVSWTIAVAGLCPSTGILISQNAMFHRLGVHAVTRHYRWLPTFGSNRTSGWCMVPGTFPLSLDLPQWSRSAILRLYGCLPSEPLLSMQLGPGKKPTQAQFHFFSQQDLAFQAFNDPKSINREASETTLLGVTLGGWNATYFWTLGGMMSWWFQVFCSGLLFWYAMIIAVAELLLACWNVLTVDKNISCLEDDPLKKEEHRLKMICHCYQPNTIQSSVHVTSCCIISKQTTKHLSCLLFFHYMIKRINLYP